MFYRFIEQEDGKDKFGRTNKEALKEHARWCLETVRDNVPDEIAMKHIHENSPSWLPCPEEFKKHLAGDAAFNAYTELKCHWDYLKEFYSPEEIAWVDSWIPVKAKFDYGILS